LGVRKGKLVKAGRREAFLLSSHERGSEEGGGEGKGGGAVYPKEKERCGVDF